MTTNNEHTKMNLIKLKTANVKLFLKYSRKFNEVNVGLYSTDD